MTYNDRAWNEYIKKGLDYVEMGSFKSITAYHIKQWPAVSSTSENTTSNINQVRILTEKQKSAEQCRQFEQQIAEQAFELARTDVESAMALIQKMIPTKFLTHSNWYVFKLFCERLFLIFSCSSSGIITPLSILIQQQKQKPPTHLMLIKI